MTAIIAIKKGKRIVMAADGLTTTDTSRWPISTEEKMKITRVNGSPDCLIGIAGECGKNLTIKNIENLLNGKSDVDYKFIVNKMIPKIYNKLDEVNLISKGEKYNQIDSVSLLATKSHLYKISGYGLVTEVSNVVCIGSGEDMLICKYLSLKNTEMDIKDIAIECVKHAIKNGHGIGYPIVVMENERNVPIEIIEI